LIADESEADPHLHQEFPQELREPGFKVALKGFFAEHENIEAIGIFGDLLCKIGLRRRKRGIKLSESFALAATKRAVDQNRPTP